MLHKRILSFGYAFNGLKVAWQEEAHFKFHTVTALAALVAAWYFDISKIELMIIVVLIGIVMTAELFNTALEEFCDMVKSDPDPHIGKIKDLAAAAVFVSSIVALVVGLKIFIPHALALL